MTGSIYYNNINALFGGFMRHHLYTEYYLNFAMKTRGRFVQEKFFNDSSDLLIREKLFYILQNCTLRLTHAIYILKKRYVAKNFQFK